MEPSVRLLDCSAPIFNKLMTGLTMLLPCTHLTSPLSKPLLSPEEIDALLYGKFPDSPNRQPLDGGVSGRLVVDQGLREGAGLMPAKAVPSVFACI